MAKMEIRLHRAKALGAGLPTSRSGNVPDVAELVSDGAPAITGWVVIRRSVYGRGTCPEGASVGGVGIGDVEMSCHRVWRILFIRLGELDDRVADSHLGVHNGAVGPRHANPLGGLEG